MWPINIAHRLADGRLDAHEQAVLAGAGNTEAAVALGVHRAADPLTLRSHLTFRIAARVVGARGPFRAALRPATMHITAGLRLAHGSCWANVASVAERGAAAMLVGLPITTEVMVRARVPIQA